MHQPILGVILFALFIMFERNYWREQPPPPLSSLFPPLNTMRFYCDSLRFQSSKYTWTLNSNGHAVGAPDWDFLLLYNHVCCWQVQRILLSHLNWNEFKCSALNKKTQQKCLLTRKLLNKHISNVFSSENCPK